VKTFRVDRFIWVRAKPVLDERDGLAEAFLTERAAEPVVWIIDSQQWPRAYLRGELIERGWDAVGLVSLEHALVALGLPRYPRPQIIVIELKGLDAARDKLDILFRLGVPVVVLGGAVELNQEWVAEFDWAAVIRRPFTIGSVADTVEELASGRSA
jgi:hypothetical protein